MAIKLGSSDISKLYLGSTEVTKAYLGSDVVYAPSAGGGWVTTDLVQYIDPFASIIGGGTVSDLSGNGNDATINGSMSTDASGWVLGSGKYLTGMASTDLSGDYSIEIWFNADTLAGGTQPGLIYVYGGGGRPSTGIAVDGTSGLYSQTRSTSGGVTFQLRWAGTLNDSAWHHFVVTRISGTTYFYRDKVLADSTATTAGNLTSSNVWKIGGPIGTFLRYWTSSDRLGLFRIYEKGLDTSEITQNYDANKADYGL